MDARTVVSGERKSDKDVAFEACRHRHGPGGILEHDLGRHKIRNKRSWVCTSVVS